MDGLIIFISPSLVAFVVPDEVSYGITRMFEAYGNDLGFQMSSFRNMDDAKIWLET